MKKLLQLLSGITTCAAISLQASAQADIAGSNGHIGTSSNQYVGWDAGTNFDLQIRHDADRPITFHAGINSGNPSSTERMRITPGNGFVGIGLTAPQNLLHLNTYDNYSAVYSQYITNLRS